jgi:chlorite dismutase
VHNPFVPETLEGWIVLHLMYRIDWGRLREAYPGDRQQMADDVVKALAVEPSDGASTLVQLVGKGDLMVILFRTSFDELGRAQLAFSNTKLYPYLVPTTSYVSVVELGMYEMTAKIHRQLTEKGLLPDSDEYQQGFDEEMERQRQRVRSRLFTEIPRARHVCFYPMNKRRGEMHNWYSEPFARRAEMMLEHGKVGREYAGKVTQIISGSVGFDDWEWGVDLFAEEALTFKRLIYEMRFDEASARYAEFGPFYVGLQFDPAALPQLLDGQLPGL